jgi:hypothetical protein
MKGCNTRYKRENNKIIQLGVVKFRKNETYEQIGKKE